MHPTSQSRFATLPAELHGEIASKADISTLSLLSRVSHSFYGYCNALLYHNVNNASVPTLALQQEDRLPLTSPHPATFVKGVTILDRDGFYDEPWEDGEKERLKEHIPAAMNNILKYAPKDGVRSFAFKARYISLPEMFTVDVPAWRSLDCLIIKSFDWNAQAVTSSLNLQATYQMDI
ncbi:hypothetical protein BT96DRAFT_1006954 [Gymnopus androsaceus JB14]|uniref:F-box domain-containing protein n=1 Tax=Gymnopus androsaceus JB14 TaxID=1447944 RepID=A0A6A4GIV8_9AGAR|nr:hypothetical protein BT96DRAFT_1006954 [Gymnopus androsaceus JB14]